MNLARCHTPVRNAEGKITHYVDDERIAHSVENIRDAMTSGDDSYGAVSWTSDIEDDDLIAIWGMSDDDITMSDAQAPSTATENEDSGNDSSCIVSDDDNENVVSENTSMKETEAGRKSDERECAEEQSAERKRRRTLCRRRCVYWADNISYYGYYASWIFFGIFIIGRLVPSAPLISFIGVIGSIVSVSVSLIASEALGKLNGQYGAIRTVPITVVALVLVAVGLYGLFSGDPELSTAGVIGLLAWSFVPSLIDMVKQHGSDFEYREYEYDDDGNVTNADDFEDATSDGRYRTYSSGNAFSAINEVFGIPQPVDPPPIEVSRDDMYEDEWGRVLGSVEVIRDENGDVILRAIDTSKEHEEHISEAECAHENNDTL